MSAEETRHVALPKLYGAPAYARPTVVAPRSDRPFDPDELPLVVTMTDEERARLEQLEAAQMAVPPVQTVPKLTPRPFSLRTLAERLRGGRG